MKLTLKQLKQLIKESVEDARHALDKLQPTNSVNKDFLKTPLSVAKLSLSDIAKTAGTTAKAVQKLAQRAKLPTITVNPKTLLSFQTFVTRYGIERILSGSRESQGKQDIPTVIQTLDGELIVIDGNHRIVAAILSGNNTVTVRIVDLNSLVTPKTS